MRPRVAAVRPCACDARVSSRQAALLLASPDAGPGPGDSHGDSPTRPLTSANMATCKPVQLVSSALQCGDILFSSFFLFLVQCCMEASWRLPLTRATGWITGTQQPHKQRSQPNVRRDLAGRLVVVAKPRTQR